MRLPITAAFNHNFVQVTGTRWIVASRPAFPLTSTVPIRVFRLVMQEHDVCRERHVDAGIRQCPLDPPDHPPLHMDHVGP